jgi:hypothetical protein
MSGKLTELFPVRVLVLSSIGSRHGKHDDTPRRHDPTELEQQQQPFNRGPGAPTAQLWRDVESGRAGDRVSTDNMPVLDPAASPLGVVDEAANVPSSPKGLRSPDCRDRDNRERDDGRTLLDHGHQEPPLRLVVACGALLAIPLSVGASPISFRRARDADLLIGHQKSHPHANQLIIHHEAEELRAPAVAASAA